MDSPLCVRATPAKLMTSADYRESLRRYKPRVFVDGQAIESVADAPSLRPGVNALGVTYDFALRPELAPVMTAIPASSPRCGSSTAKIFFRSFGQRRLTTTRSASSLTVTRLLLECRSMPQNFIPASIE